MDCDAPSMLLCYLPTKADLFGLDCTMRKAAKAVEVAVRETTDSVNVAVALVDRSVDRLTQVPKEFNKDFAKMVEWFREDLANTDEHGMSTSDKQ